MLVGAAAGCPDRGAGGPPDAADGGGRDAPTDAVRDAGGGEGRADAGSAGDGSADSGAPDGGAASDGGLSEGRPIDGADVSPGDSAPPAPDAATIDGPGGNSGDAGGGGDGGDPQPAPGSYAAAVLHGGLDRLVIVKSDPGRNLCFRLTLRAPDTESVLPLRLPDTWQVEAAGATAGGDCAPGALPAPAVTAATAGSGSVTWPGPLPCAVDVDVTLRFASPSLPAEEILRVRALVPIGC